MTYVEFEPVWKWGGSSQGWGLGCDQHCINKGWGMKTQLSDDKTIFLHRAAFTNTKLSQRHLGKA